MFLLSTTGAAMNESLARLIEVIGMIIGTTAGVSWFIADQFRRHRLLLYRVMSRHNKEDDDRFAVLWTRITGEKWTPFPRRDYFEEG